MKTIEVHYRVGRTERIFGGYDEEGNEYYLPESHKSTTETIEVETAKDIIELFPPLKPSENLLNALTELIDGRKDKVVYNFGRGNATFFGKNEQ